MKIPLPPLPTKDKLAQLPANDGNFSVKKAYWFGSYLYHLSEDHAIISKQNQQIQHFWKQIWKPDILPRISTWIWQASYNKLPTADNLFKRSLTTANLGTYCGRDSETLHHILYQCPFAKEVQNFLHMNTEPCGNLLNFWSSLLLSQGSQLFQYEALIYWKLYMEGQKQPVILLYTAHFVLWFQISFILLLHVSFPETEYLRMAQPPLSLLFSSFPMGKLTQNMICMFMWMAFANIIRFHRGLHG